MLVSELKLVHVAVIENGFPNDTPFVLFKDMLTPNKSLLTSKLVVITFAPVASWVRLYME